MLKILDHSAISMWKLCRKKFFYQYVLGHGLKKPPLPLLRGGAIHHGKDLWNKDKPPQDVLRGMQEYLYKEMFEVYPPEEIAQVQGLCDDTLEAYMTKYANDDAEYAIVESEVPVSMRLGPFWYVGIEDSIVRKVSSNTLLIEETKTTTMQPYMWEQKYYMDEQTLGYLRLARANGYEVQGILLNLLCVPDGKKRKYPELFRSEFYPPDQLVDEWEREALRVAAEIFRCVTDYDNGVPNARDAFFKDTEACHKWFRSCHFIEWCMRSQLEEHMPEFFGPRHLEREERILKDALSYKETYNADFTAAVAPTQRVDNSNTPRDDSTYEESAGGEPALPAEP